MFNDNYYDCFQNDVKNCRSMLDLSIVDGCSISRIVSGCLGSNIYKLATK